MIYYEGRSFSAFSDDGQAHPHVATPGTRVVAAAITGYPTITPVDPGWTYHGATRYNNGGVYLHLFSRRPLDEGEPTLYRFLQGGYGTGDPTYFDIAAFYSVVGGVNVDVDVHAVASNGWMQAFVPAVTTTLDNTYLLGVSSYPITELDTLWDRASYWGTYGAYKRLSAAGTYGPYAAGISWAIVLSDTESTEPSAGAVAISPETATLAPGETQQFTASISGVPNLDIIWSCSRGSISASGLFEAPDVGDPVVVTATSAYDPTQSASATVTVVLPPGVTRRLVIRRWGYRA